MKLLITNYTFNHIAKTVTFNDYLSTGISLYSVLLIVDVTTNQIIYNFSDSTKGGTVSSNVLTLTFNTTGLHDTDNLLIYFDDPLALQNVNLGTGVRQDLDSITTYPVGTTYKNLSASGIILAQPGRLRGITVNSTSSGIIRIWDNASTNSGNKILDQIQLSIGSYSLFDMQGILGAYMELVSGSINVTFATL